MAIMSYICRRTTSINHISICIHIIETVALTCHAANMQATVLQHIKHPVKARNIANNAMRACTTALRKVLTHLQTFARPFRILL